MVLLLARVIGIGIETADMLVQEVLSRNLRDRRAVARYAGLTGSPDESGSKRREKGLSRSGNARVRRGMVQLAWRFLDFQKVWRDNLDESCRLIVAQRQSAAFSLSFGVACAGGRPRPRLRSRAALRR